MTSTACRVVHLLHGIGEIDDLGKLDLLEADIDASKQLDNPADGILGKVGEPRPRQQLDDLPREVGPDLFGMNAALFCHFYLPAQFLANALQPFTDDRLVDACIARQSRRRPAAVITAVAEQPFDRRQRQQRTRKMPPLQVRPGRLVLVQHGDVEHVVERQERDAARTPHVECNRDDDAAKPSGKTGCVLEVAQTPERAKVRFLRRVLRERRIPQYTFCDSVRHRLRLVHEAPKRVEVAGPCAGHQVIEVTHISSLATQYKDTGSAEV